MRDKFASHVRGISAPSCRAGRARRAVSAAVECFAGNSFGDGGELVETAEPAMTGRPVMAPAALRGAGVTLAALENFPRPNDGRNRPVGRSMVRSVPEAPFRSRTPVADGRGSSALLRGRRHRTMSRTTPEIDTVATQPAAGAVRFLSTSANP